MKLFKHLRRLAIQSQESKESASAAEIALERAQTGLIEAETMDTASNEINNEFRRLREANHFAPRLKIAFSAQQRGMAR